MSYDISYQQVNISSAGDGVMTSRLYGWQEGDEYWLSCEFYIIHTTYYLSMPLSLEYCTVRLLIKQ